MKMFRLSAAAAAFAASACLALPASANGALSPADGVRVRSLPAVEPLSPVIAITNFNVAGIFSVDPLGDPLNEVRTIMLAPNASVIGIGWNVTLFADSPSWLSEMAVMFGSSSTTAIVSLRPGVGDNFPGIESYSSGGIVDLVGLGLSFDVDADGVLRMEFFETFDDFPNDWDGIWESGALSIQWSAPGGGGVVPEPASWAMMIAGFGVVGLAARRRRRALAA